MDAPLLPIGGRPPGALEFPCDLCGAAACYTLGPPARPANRVQRWCFPCAPADFRPGRAQ